ncbi:unnamed protein product [Polarella glacialis]|uniref:Cytochrome P450 n=1 Tax=Polarella glacialis TaxID=89957 RepID=A0A813LDS5_POLGL|nr:unnamed protein product [Polarella glacialis]
MASLPDARILRKIFKAYGLLSLTQVVVQFILDRLRTRRMYRMLRGVPMAAMPPLGFMGNIPHMVQQLRRIHAFRDEISRGFGVCWTRGILGDDQSVFLLVRDPACIRHFLKDAFAKYTKPFQNRDIMAMYFHEWLGDGIFSARHGPTAPDGGRLWSIQRKIAAHIFSRTNFTNFMQDVFQSKADRLCAVLSEASLKSKGQAVDMQSLFFKFTMDSVMSIFFGEKTDLIGGQSNLYGQAFDEAHECLIRYVFSSLPFNKVTSFLPWPFGGWNGLSWRLHAALSPTCRRFRAARQTLDAEAYRLIRNCRADPNLSQRRDLLALFVQSKENFSDGFLRDVVLSFVIAGRDTTACLLSWMFYALATNPDVQAELCREVDEKLVRKDQDQDQLPGWRSLSHTEMPFLHGVLYETLRLWPPVPVDLKQATEDDVLPDGTPVPRNAKVVFIPYAMGRDPANYPDPEAFRPQRWIPFVAPAPHEFPVFQAGPRICLGMDMAIFEAKLVAATLLRRFRFELQEGQAELITYGYKLTMNVCNDLGQEKESDHLWLVATPRGP